MELSTERWEEQDHGDNNLDHLREEFRARLYRGSATAECEQSPPKCEHHDTPVSDRALREDWPEFEGELYKRLLAGKRDYGDRSFSREPLALLGEIEQELLDVSGWAFILFCRIRNLRRALLEP